MFQSHHKPQADKDEPIKRRHIGVQFLAELDADKERARRKTRDAETLLVRVFKLDCKYSVTVTKYPNGDIIVKERNAHNEACTALASRRAMNQKVDPDLESWITMFLRVGLSKNDILQMLAHPEEVPLYLPPPPIPPDSKHLPRYNPVAKWWYNAVQKNRQSQRLAASDAAAVALLVKKMQSVSGGFAFYQPPACVCKVYKCGLSCPSRRCRIQLRVETIPVRWWTVAKGCFWSSLHLGSAAPSNPCAGIVGSSTLMPPAVQICMACICLPY
jgi:hypothetical protein